MRPPVRCAGLPGHGARTSARLRSGRLRARGERARARRASPHESRCRPSSPRRRHRSPPSPRWQSAPHRPRTQRAPPALLRRRKHRAPGGRDGGDDLPLARVFGVDAGPVAPGRAPPGVRADDRRGGRRPHAGDRGPAGAREHRPRRRDAAGCAVTSATASDDGGRTPVADRSPRKEGDDRRGGPVVRPAPSPPPSEPPAEPSPPLRPDTDDPGSFVAARGPRPRPHAARRSEPGAAHAARRPALAPTAHLSAPVV